MKKMNLILILISMNIVGIIEGHKYEHFRRMFQRQACPDSGMCRSKWGYCGTGSDYCGDGCTAGPCSGNNNGGSGGDIINDETFACAFNTIDSATRTSRLNGLRESGWKPANKDEAAVFLGHVFHETDGLKTLREYCAPGIYSSFIIYYNLT
jgi:chitinase